MGHVNSFLPRILHMGMGKPSSNPSDVLCELCLLARGLLPHHADEFRNTTISHDLHYIAWDHPLKQHPRSLSMEDFDKMVESGAPFARKFPRNDRVLDRIDRELLGRSEGRFTPCGWCIGEVDGGEDPSTMRRKDSVFKPGSGAERLEKLMKKLTSEDFRNGRCSSLRYDQTKESGFVIDTQLYVTFE